jgi:CRISP-associated protein Cas1
MAVSERSRIPRTLMHSLDDDHNWRIRSELWNRRSSETASRRAKRERQREPLVLCGHGVSLRVEGGSLLIRNGLTDYPQKQELYHFFKGELAIPERIILLDGSGSISFDVLSWLAEQNVSLIRIDWRGDVVCVASRSGYAAKPFRVQWQRGTRNDENLRMEFSISKNHPEDREFDFDAGKIHSAQRGVGQSDGNRLFHADAIG